MSKMTMAVRQGTGRKKATTSKKAAKTAATKKKVTKIPKLKKPKTPKFALTPGFISRANKEFDGIQKDKDSVGESYFALRRRCRQFGDEKLYKGVKDENGNYFKTFRESMKFVFDKSAATMFAEMRIEKKLLPVIGEKDLSQISKENQKHIIDLSPTQQGEDKVIEAAKELTAKEFELKFPAKKKQTAEVKKAVASRKATSEQFTLNVSPGLYKRLKYVEDKALRVFAPDITDGDYSETLRAKAWEGYIEDTFQGFCDNHENALFPGEQEAAGDD